MQACTQECTERKRENIVSSIPVEVDSNPSSCSDVFEFDISPGNLISLEFPGCHDSYDAHAMKDVVAIQGDSVVVNVVRNKLDGVHF